jgi:hypothetical protein
MTDEDALRDADDVKSGDELRTPGTATTSEDDGNVGDATGEGDAGPASCSTTVG